jgi:hypothetical protein
VNVNLLRLLFAGFWLIVGILLIGYQTTTGDRRLVFPLGTTELPLGYFVLILSAYNLLRWYMLRPRPMRERSEPTSSLERHVMRSHHEEPPPEPDPAFDFSNKPPDTKPTT